jgi:hypothetical protein
MKGHFPSKSVIAVLAVLLLSGLPDTAPAEFNVNINIGTPPVVVAEPAEVVLIPRIGVYFVPDGDTDLFFYAGFWWSPRGDRWYRSRVCNGPWVVVERRIVPVEVVRVPRDYRVRYVKAKHVPYGQWKKAHYRKADDNGERGDHQKRKKHKKMGNRGYYHDDK